MPHHRALVAVLSLLLPAVASAQAATSLCDGPARPLAPSRDLWCIELVATPDAVGASGRVALAQPDGPFTVAVTREGALRYAPELTLAGLPALRAESTYVAWAATPTMGTVVRLGTVSNGRTARLAPIDFDKFVVLVTAERDARGAEPAGRLVLRAGSPSTRLQPPDIFQFALGATRDTVATHVAHGHEGHAQQGSAPVADTAAWRGVPMPRGLDMLPAEMALRPGVAPWRPAAPEGQTLPDARPREIATLASGDTLRLTAGRVRRTLKGKPYVAYGFNGQYPGPLLRVPQGAEIVVEYTNALDQPSTVHWHGVRLDNANDGVPELTQPAVPPGGRFTYRLRFPDAGVYWYHPHVREDAQQDLGLYGNILVRSPRPDWWPAAHREEALLLDDILATADGPVPHGREAPTHALMGRFGNVLLVNGEPDWSLKVKRGEVVRLLLTNASNARTFNLSFGAGTRMKVVGADVGRLAREAWVESVVLAPAERWVVQVRFDRAGDVALVNRVQGLDHLYGRFFYESDTLGVVHVEDARAAAGPGASFDLVHSPPEAVAEIAEALRRPREKPRALVLTMEDRGLPYLTRQLMQLDSTYFTPVEWSGTMPSMNWAATADQVRWVVLDPATGKRNLAIDDWHFARGAMVPLTIVNERRSMHAMQHPVHLHGQRFLVLAVNGRPTTHRAWKDTVLVPVGTTVELLVEMSNPGRWMLHCHIAEHMEADMMMHLVVE